MKKSEKWKVQFFVMAFCVLGLVAVLVGSSYAIFSDVSDQGDYNTVTAGTLQLSYEDTQSLSLSNLYPVSDVEGMTGEGYTFTVRNIGTLPSDYKVMIQDDEAMIQADGCSDHLMPKANIKVSVNGGTPFLLSSIAESNYMITTGNLQPGESVTHVVKVWIDEASGNEVLGTHFHGKVVVEGVQGAFVYQDESGANVPKLVEGMIPVVYDEAQASWVKADITNKWYDYNSQEWANSVTVTETNRASYMSASAGTVIPMEDINTMWVWIPRYEYMYTNLGDQYAGGTEVQPGEIKVNFLNGTSTTPSDAANYKVHPAFTFGDEELTGLWYGKFEMSILESCIAADGDVNKGCDLTTFTLQIKPSVESWLGARVSTFFESIRGMQTNKYVTYGFANNESYDIHMSKNSEWGAVAYLSQSKYGKYGNPNYEGVNKEVAINNCENYITGIGGDTVSDDSSSATCTTNTYETAKGQAASTTGNITGIYDMSGGGYEYVMGVLADENGNPRGGASSSYNSGFNGSLNSGSYNSGIDFPEAKYYDLYTTSNVNTACSEGICYGHALSEILRWYGDNPFFIDSAFPWFARGGHLSEGVQAGVFLFTAWEGGTSIAGSSRAVLVPEV